MDISDDGASDECRLDGHLRMMIRCRVVEEEVKGSVVSVSRLGHVRWSRQRAGVVAHHVRMFCLIEDADVVDLEVQEPVVFGRKVRKGL